MPKPNTTEEKEKETPKEAEITTTSEDGPAEDKKVPQAQYDHINPAHYKRASIETIEKMRRIYGPILTIAYCEMTAFKYRERIGLKPDQPLEQEMGKIRWYENKALELKNQLTEEEARMFETLVTSPTA